MLLYCILCYIFIIPLFMGIPLKQSSASSTTSKQLDTVYTPQDTNSIKTKIIIEGGTILQKPNTSLTLPKENNVNLLAVDEELSKGKSDNPFASKVVPRKGVPIFTNAHDSVVHDQIVTNPNKISVDHHEKALKKSDVPISVQNVTIIPKVFDKNKLNEYNKTLKSSQIPHKVNKAVPLKPLILSYETLSNLKENIIATHPLSKTITDRLSSPSINGPTIKVQANANRYPGLVTPLIISILLVPMFAVLGYMALRRGQEAWKNRHYKRMDFLLDGMYNE